MAKKLLIVSSALALVFALALATSAQEKYSAAPMTVAQTSTEFSPATFCNLDKTTPAKGIYGGYWQKGDNTVTYYDPADPPPGGCGAISPYPFEITSFSFAFFSP